MSTRARPLPPDARSQQQRQRRSYKTFRRGGRTSQLMSDEQRITVCKTAVTQIYAMLASAPQSWRNYLNLARSVIAHLDVTTFTRQPARTSEQIWIISGLQQLAHMDTELREVTDIAAWCSRQWLEILQRDPNNIAALRGIGQAWLHRAQPVLARIQQTESGSSSSGNGSQRSLTERSPDIEEGRPSSSSRSDTERRMDAQEYVEARQYLQPATEYLSRAVHAATTQNVLSGELLITAAETHLSLGNVSGSRNSEEFFRRSLTFLRTASSIEGFVLPRHLQQYLDEYGRLLD